MIKKEEIFEVGIINKPHGVYGELSIAIKNFNFNIETLPFLILKIEGLSIPFFIQTYRIISDESIFIKFEDIDTKEDAMEFSNTPVFIKKKYLLSNDDELGFRLFIGYSIDDEQLGRIGEIVDIDEKTENELFVVDRDNEEKLIPATLDFIKEVDKFNKVIHMELPEGLINFDLAIPE